MATLEVLRILDPLQKILSRALAAVQIFADGVDPPGYAPEFRFPQDERFSQNTSNLFKTS